MTYEMKSKLFQKKVLNLPTHQRGADRNESSLNICDQISMFPSSHKPGNELVKQVFR